MSKGEALIMEVEMSVFRAESVERLGRAGWLNYADPGATQRQARRARVPEEEPCTVDALQDSAERASEVLDPVDYYWEENA